MDYFESGHGKGSCDGVGGAVKRSADMALKKGHLIKSAQDFYRWGVQQETSAVDYLLVEKEEVAKAGEEMALLGRLQVPGTMKVHSVIPLGTKVYTRSTSCYQECCWSEAEFRPTCPGWTSHADIQNPLTEDAKEVAYVEKEVGVEKKRPVETVKDPEPRVHVTVAVEEVCVGDFVAAQYMENIYLGKVLDIEEGEYHIT